MKIEHAPTGPICERCGAPAGAHRGKRNRTLYRREYKRSHPDPKARERIIGIDGEGQGRKPHIYNYLAAADEFGKVWSLGDNPNQRIRTEEFLDFMLALPDHALLFMFAGLYDLTKGLTDLSDRELFLLFHENKREFLYNGRILTRPVKWPDPKTGPYILNYRRRCFSVKHGAKRRTLWDIFAFFQSSFFKACVDWKIGAPPGWNWNDKKAPGWDDALSANVHPELLEIASMKEKRSVFDSAHIAAIKSYCNRECSYLSQLGRSLLDAHETAGFELEDFYGAGSTAKALMNKHNVKNFIGQTPDLMREAIACAFFGGRFENSVIGAIRRPVWNADIASAYPYAATALPCLTHGSWEFCNSGKLDGRIERATLALINWHLPKTQNELPWGPLPVRKADGTIAFPLAARSGWTWKNEFLAARNLRPDIVALGAWLYTTDCDCQPFSFLPAVYLERLRIGKDGAGIVLKLGPNSVYGKLVQSVGHKPPFQCWVWGGCITSECRAQLLQAIYAAANPADILMLATDGVWSDSVLTLPAPRDTGTANSFGKPPLGGWEVKKYPRGVFAARPGIYFPLAPTEEDLQKVRARGLGRKVLYEAHKTLTEAYERGEPGVRIFGGQRFIGAKTGMSWSPNGGVKRSKDYGEWIDWPIEVSFDPRPKREVARKNGTLKCWDYFDAPSLPYDNAIKSEEDKLLALAKLIDEEQPTAEFVEE